MPPIALRFGTAEVKKMDAYWRAANYWSVGQIYLLDNLHGRGDREEGTTTTPFDRGVLNHLDRFSLVMDVTKQVPKLQPQAAHIKQRMRDKLNEHTRYIHEHGEEIPEIRNWKWPEAKA